MLKRTLAAAALAACGCASPTAPTAVLAQHPNEVLITEFVACYAETRGLGDIRIDFFEEPQYADCGLGDGSQCPVAGRGMPYSDLIRFWGPYIRGETEHDSSPAMLARYAAHEVCHVSGIWPEDGADACAALIFDQCYDGPAASAPRGGVL
jgi:hypothetical protein